MTIHKIQRRLAICILAPTAIVFLLVFPSFLHGEESSCDGALSAVSFPISIDDGSLLLPVTIEGKTYRFLVDTGATLSIFDRTLPLGRQLRTGKAKAAGGDSMTIYIHEPPTATIGSMPLDCPNGVFAIDMTPFRLGLGVDVHGLIGMDFLRSRIVQIDSDIGEMRFLKTLPSNPGSGLTMAYARGGLPHLLFQLAEFKDKAFMLDTGMLSLDSGTLAINDFAQLETSRELKMVGRGRNVTASGTRTIRIGRASKLLLGEFEVVDPVFAESGGNKVGLKFLSRFVATIDFPGEKLYLKKGRRYADADLWDLSGLHIVRKDGKVVIDTVEKESVAAVAGIEAGMSIVKVNEHDSGKMTLADIRRRCCQPGTLSLRVNRLDQTSDVRLELKQ